MTAELTAPEIAARDDVQSATIAIRTDREIGRIDPKIYGHFLESNFFGNILGGLFDEDSPFSHTGPGARRGLRQDAIDVCRELGLPIVRWPGGNFTSAYRWEDGIGPRDQRPRRLDLTWGGEEGNRFGTDEFLAWCAEVDTEPFLVHSCRDVEDAVRWVEYTNHGGDTHYTRRRAANGHPEPYGVKYWGIGNECYGPWQMGYRTGQEYAVAAREHARFMRIVDPDLKLVAVGIPWHQEQWTRPLIETAGGLFDYVSLHLYGASTHLYTGDDDYENIVSQPLYFSERIESYSEMVADLAENAGLDRPLSLALDEWNVRHLEPNGWPEPEAGLDGGIASRDLPSGVPTEGRKHLRVNRWSPRTVADALCYAGIFSAMHRLSGLEVAPRMANTVNLINANAPIAVRPGGMVRSTTYHVWDLYQNHMGSIAVDTEVEGPARHERVRQGDHEGHGGFETRWRTVPSLDVSTTLTEDRASVRIAVINRHRSTPVTTRLVLDGHAVPPRARVRDIGADAGDVLAANSLAEPDRVTLVDRGEVALPGGRYTFPPHSITLLSFDL
ncbi:alpha-L-arabinofuranosidase C-terminal domain-containing protein [Nonomuraea endophytica]|uniref:alpha-L-arabinofuranosidase C-terminal domain-containing protein n=1 Tax=Nonomuraea endophytica TaxID=714136 RepID=UPI0037CBF3ED